MFHRRCVPAVSSYPTEERRTCLCPRTNWYNVCRRFQDGQKTDSGANVPSNWGLLVLNRPSDSLRRHPGYGELKTPEPCLRRF